MERVLMPLCMKKMTQDKVPMEWNTDEVAHEGTVRFAPVATAEAGKWQPGLYRMYTQSHTHTNINVVLVIVRCGK